MHVNLACSFDVAFSSFPPFVTFLKKEVFLLDISENLVNCRIIYLGHVSHDIRIS